MIKIIEKIMGKMLPSPFSIAILLTIIIIIISLIFTENSILEIISFWEKGLWHIGLMNFAMQMMLMLVLGYVIALSSSVKKLIDNIIILCNNTSKAAFFISLSTIAMSFLNWGLGLVFGAILVRKVGEHSIKHDLSLNYPLIGAAGYSGLMVWHGGLSGSIPLKVSEKNHFSEIINTEHILNQLPANGINFDATIFSSMNIFVSILLLVIIPAFLYYLGKQDFNIKKIKFKHRSNIDNPTKRTYIGAEKIDYSTWFNKIIGILIILIAVQKIITANSIAFINPNFINLSLFGFAILLHNNINDFLKSVNNAIGSASGILIQFPLYFGIMGIMNSSGLVDIFANFFVSISNELTYPIFTMFSGGLVNIFVPSGGGQWAVQGPIVLQSAIELGVSLPKSIMALAYGDQLTNMLQPFWALPLLGITELKATEILPYTILIMLVGLVIFTSCLLIF